MHLVQLLLPLRGADGEDIHRAQFERVAKELTDRFGGMTAYTRAPASGLWQPSRAERTERDDIVVYEVMVEDLDAGWWAGYRDALEKRFAQRELVVRAQECRRL
jgi:hypothetical protein